MTHPLSAVPHLWETPLLTFNRSHESVLCLFSVFTSRLILICFKRTFQWKYVACVSHNIPDNNSLKLLPKTHSKLTHYSSINSYDNNRYFYKTVVLTTTLFRLQCNACSVKIKILVNLESVCYVCVCVVHYLFTTLVK